MEMDANTNALNKHLEQQESNEAEYNARVTEMTYHHFIKLREILNTNHDKGDIIDILDMAMSSGESLESCLIDFCNDNDICQGELNE